MTDQHALAEQLNQMSGMLDLERILREHRNVGGRCACCSSVTAGSRVMFPCTLHQWADGQRRRPEAR